jgi:hypothetical protein
MDSDSPIFVFDLQFANKKLIKKVFQLITFFERSKVQKKSQNSRNKGFSYYFCLMTKGSGSIPLTSGSGSGRPKTCRSGGSLSGFGSGTLVPRQITVRYGTYFINSTCEREKNKRTLKASMFESKTVFLQVFRVAFIIIRGCDFELALSLS